MTQGASDDLAYVSDEMPGIKRCRRGGRFIYRDPQGRWLKAQREADQADLDRIRRLAIPPAYVDVWICPLAHGHLQATGRDARGRKQYRYHPGWREAQEAQKFERMRAFGESLPRLRRRVSRDLRAAEQGFPTKACVLATLVRLLDTTFMRIGNEEYARSNQSFGLTTLRNRHAQVRQGRLKLRFRGKSGVEHEVEVDDPRVARIVRRCQALPGQDLFQYQGEDGATHRVGSAEVNAYIRDACGGDFTAKDFRTWHATVHAWHLLAVRRMQPVTAVVREVARLLGNTVAVCRKSYIHPRVLACGAEAKGLPARPAPPRSGLNAAERELLGFLGEDGVAHQ